MVINNFNGKLIFMRKQNVIHKNKRFIDEENLRRLNRKWLEVRKEVFKRDKLTCIKCGFHYHYERKYYNENSRVYCLNKCYHVLGENKDNKTLIFGSQKGLIVDHIIPIALGGNEWSLNNLQTLCSKCNIKKTTEDLKNIHLFKKNQKEKLNLKTIECYN